MTEARSGALADERPASSAETRAAYLDQSVVGYLLYGVGAATAFLAVALSLSDSAAALHSSLLATGLLGAGFLGHRLDAVLGSRRTHWLAYLLLVVAIVCIVTAPAYAVTLAGAAFVGLGTGLLLAHLNRALTRGGGTLARVRMGRAALVAMVATVCVPIAIGIGENSGLGWQMAFVVALGLVAVGLGASRRRPQVQAEVVVSAGRLSRGYWLTWGLLVLGVSVEFSLVFWASTLVERQVGIPLADATLVATGFYAGMATSRVALSFHAVSRRDPVAMIRLGLGVALVGSLLAWVTSDIVFAAVGVYLGGVGTGFIYPLSVTVALALVPSLQDRGSSRLILASGLAILVAPFVLGVAADAAGVATAWLLIPILCVAALALSVPVSRARSAETG